MVGEADAATALEDAAGFLIVGVGAVFLTLQVPTLVNGLSGTITATANGVAMALGGAGFAQAAAGRTASGMRDGYRAASPALRGEAEAWAAGGRAAAAGGDAAEARAAERQRQKAHRLKYARNATQFAAMHGRQASGVERFKAANAGQQFEIRKARRARKDGPPD